MRHISAAFRLHLLTSTFVYWSFIDLILKKNFLQGQSRLTESYGTVSNVWLFEAATLLSLIKPIRHDYSKSSCKINAFN
jgi:hypothetical protein